MIVAKPTRPAYLFCDVDMKAAEELRSRLAESGSKITVMAILLKAIALAQLDHPLSRSFRLPWGAMVTLPNPVAGFTVERFIDGQPAVYFGVIDEPVKSTLTDIAQDLKEYSDLEFSDVPQLKLQSLFSGVPWFIRQVSLWFAMRSPLLRKQVNAATFGLSNLGKFGLRSLIGPCVSTCVFGSGSVEPRAAVINDRVEVRPMLTLSLSVDTRVMSMYEAAEFMQQVKLLLECGLASPPLSVVGEHQRHSFGSHSGQISNSVNDIPVLSR